MSKITKEMLLEKWCAERGVFSKAELMQYGLDMFYLRAWRTVCDLVVKGKSRKLTEQECRERKLPTSMAHYEWIAEPSDTPHEEVIRRVNLAQEQVINRTAFETRSGQLAFMK